MISDLPASLWFECSSKDLKHILHKSGEERGLGLDFSGNALRFSPFNLIVVTGLP